MEWDKMNDKRQPDCSKLREGGAVSAFQGQDVLRRQSSVDEKRRQQRQSKKCLKDPEHVIMFDHVWSHMTQWVALVMAARSSMTFYG